MEKIELQLQINQNKEGVVPYLEESESLHKQYSSYLKYIDTLLKSDFGGEEGNILIKIGELDLQIRRLIFESTDDGNLNYRETPAISNLINSSLNEINALVKRYEIEIEASQEKSRKNREGIQPRVSKKEQEELEKTKIEEQGITDMLASYPKELKRINKLKKEIIELAHEKIKTGNDTFAGFDDEGNGGRGSFLVEQFKQIIGDELGPDVKVQDLLRDMDTEEVLEGSKQSIIDLVEGLSNSAFEQTDYIKFNGQTFDIVADFDGVENKIREIEVQLTHIKNTIKSFDQSQTFNVLANGKVDIPIYGEVQIPNLTALLLEQLGIDTEKKVLANWTPEDFAYIGNFLLPILIFQIHKIPIIGWIRPGKRGVYKEINQLRKTNKSQQNRLDKLEGAEKAKEEAKIQSETTNLDTRKADLVKSIEKHISLMTQPEYRNKGISEKLTESNIKGLESLKQEIESGKKDVKKNIDKWEQKLDSLTTEKKTMRGFKNKNEGVREARTAAAAEIETTRINVTIAGVKVSVPEKYQSIIKSIQTEWKNFEKLNTKSTAKSMSAADLTTNRLNSQNRLIGLSNRIGVPLAEVDKAHMSKMLESFNKNLSEGKMPAKPVNPGETFTPSTKSKTRRAVKVRL